MKAVTKGGLMLKVAIVGCGKIADSHANQIIKIPECEIVGVCDKEELMAIQLYERFPVKRYFTDVQVLLEETQPHVVHITTPTQSHYYIAKQCLNYGCHVYVEKPFTLNLAEADKLIALANQKNLKLTAGHNGQFTQVMRRMRELVEKGYLGGVPVHMESCWGYELGGHYANALIADKQHWIRKLPGGLLQNIISHGIAKIAEFLKTDTPKVIATGYTSPFLKSLGEHDIIDELRVIISDEERTTAYFTFSSQIRPSVHQFCIYGPKNGLLLDDDQQSLIKLRGTRFKSYAEKFISPIIFAKQYIGNTTRNVRLFVSRDFHEDSSKCYLFKCFYRSIIEDTDVPIPYREILLTTRIMDVIFKQINVDHPSQCQSIVSKFD
ncbi:MAG: Gfo/Idh/MocA family oxidoreductase [Deltaproteobacteria bacterium]|nr:Gfo/Idh/MocA family oxidoreductase [Deltaproteobacteria bacterium]